jgi:acetyl-CoA carboxylase carboxyl transferase subunit alpha
MTKPEKTLLDFEKPLKELERKIEELKTFAQKGEVDLSQEIKTMEERCKTLKKEIYSNLTPIQIWQIAKHPQRPTTLDYINTVFSDFVELAGDRYFGDDQALIGGIAKLNNEDVIIVGHQKGKNTKDNIKKNFGMANPEGYRKALRLFKMAEKFSRPIITFIDTPGAYPGIGAEERGQAEAIAKNLREMSSLETPVICIITGEGGSGGALGIGVGDTILMLEYSIYSVISPEGCASILFKDSKRAPEAAENMKITSSDLFKIGVVDEVIKEPLGGAHNDPEETAANIKASLVKNLADLKKVQKTKLVEGRYQKFRKMGFFEEGPAK